MNDYSMFGVYVNEISIHISWHSKEAQRPLQVVAFNLNSQVISKQ